MTAYKKIVFVTALAGLVLLAGGYTTSAASGKPTGITISPAFQLVDLPANQTSQPLSFSVTNNEPSIQNLKLTTSDFNTLSETGGLFFIGSNPTQLQKKYGLSKWLELPNSEISLNPGQRVSIESKVLNLSDLAPGGHYGSINVLVEKQLGSDPGNVNVQPVASSLFFVTKQGGDIHKLSLAGATIHRTLFNLPSSTTLRFYNEGNTHIVPRGIVTVKSSSGKLISKGIINQDSSIILPETYRRFIIPIGNISSAILPGKYKLEIDYRFDGLEQVRAYQVSFWYVPTRFIITAGLTIITILLIVFGVLKYPRKFTKK